MRREEGVGEGGDGERRNSRGRRGKGGCASKEGGVNE